VVAAAAVATAAAAVAGVVVAAAVVVAGNSARFGTLPAPKETSGRPGSLRAFSFARIAGCRELSPHLSVCDGCATLNAVQLNQRALRDFKE